MPDNNLPLPDVDLWDLPSERGGAPSPGYPLAESTKSSAWSRRRVGIVAGIAGLVLGIGIGIGASGSESSGIAAAGKQFAAADLDAAVAAAVTDAEEEFAAEREQTESLAADEIARVEDELDAVKAQAEADLLAAARTAKARQRRAVAKAVAGEKRRADARVAAAKASQPQSLAGVSSGTASGSGADPRFSWCYEANDAGYGPYYQGGDAEYDWYDDAYGDGVVCES